MPVTGEPGPTGLATSPDQEGAPHSAQEAKHQLETFFQKRRDWIERLKDDEHGLAMARSFENSVGLLATDLYSDVVHFLMELLQNADDLDYKSLSGTPPSFEMKLYRRSEDTLMFETGCNESGFTLRDIRGLCNVGESKKTKAKDASSGYIGEKGVGFKSVFGVANKVHISSGDWSNLLQMRATFISVLGKNSSADRGRKLPQLRVYQATELQSVRMVGSVCDEPQPIAIEIKKKNNTVEICVLRDPFKDYERHVDDELENLFIQLCAITDPSRSKLVRHFLKESPAEFRTLLEEFGIKCSWIDEIGIVPAEVTDGGLSTASTSSIVPPVSSPALMENTDTLCTARLATDEHADITAVAVDHSPGTSSIVFDRPKETAALVDSDFFKKIGFQGEALVNESLKENIPDWDGNRHWTSHLRAEHGLSDFLDDESTTADFTYTDEAGYMGRWLEGNLEGGPAEAKACVGKITYHIEVKGTIHGKYERFHLSQGQMNMASKWTLRDGKTPTDVFLVVRVYNLANPRAAQTSSEKAKYVIYVDPWNMIFKGRLKMRASSDDGYVISASDYALDHRGY
ncbi:hypothetical protein C8034_v005273 [Colletotrichum sidae]|uniref:Protein NO VEIN C-terminal domain-containing protein n=1 Tax=Colletotrichum sidae TaxID=1347389 RepID=A0A4R8T6P6_9PEZI|nr:hypothetical protein C8034_v005273 [Colletotrichum sidae]